MATNKKKAAKQVDRKQLIRNLRSRKFIREAIADGTITVRSLTKSNTARLVSLSERGYLGRQY